MNGTHIPKLVAWIMILGGIGITLIPYLGILGDPVPLTFDSFIDNWETFALGLTIALVGVLLYPFKGGEL